MGIYIVLGIILIYCLPIRRINDYYKISLLNSIWMVRNPQNVQVSYIANVKAMLDGFDKLKNTCYYSCFTHTIIINHIKKKFKIVFMIKLPCKLNLGKMKKLLNKDVKGKELVEQYFVVFYKGTN